MTKIRTGRRYSFTTNYCRAWSFFATWRASLPTLLRISTQRLTLPVVAQTTKRFSFSLVGTTSLSVVSMSVPRNAFPTSFVGKEDSVCTPAPSIPPGGVVTTSARTFAALSCCQSSSCHFPSQLDWPSCHLSTIFTERSYKFATTVDRKVVRHAIEKLTYVA